jgi:DNA-binding protein H-NS
MNINTLSLKELRDLQLKVAKAIASFEDRRKNETLAEMEELARAKGFSLAELTGGPPVRRRSATSAKYANPANPAATWSGRGRRPGWFLEAMSQGKTPNDLAIR